MASHNKINILQANIKSLENHKMELRMELIQNKIHAAILSETWTRLEKINSYNITGYHKIIQCRSDGYGGVAIYLKNNYKYIRIPLVTSDNFEVIGIKIVNNNIYIVSVYVNPKISVLEFHLKWNNLLESMKIYENVVIAGDFNAHHTVWGSPKVNYRGKEILRTINMSNFTLVNNGKCTYYPNNLSQNPSAIDLTIVSKNLAQKIDWDVTNEKFGGNHQIIRYLMRKI